MAPNVPANPASCMMGAVAGRGAGPVKGKALPLLLEVPDGAAMLLLLLLLLGNGGCAALERVPEELLVVLFDTLEGAALEEALLLVFPAGVAGLAGVDGAAEEGEAVEEEDAGEDGAVEDSAVVDGAAEEVGAELVEDAAEPSRLSPGSMLTPACAQNSSANASVSSNPREPESNGTRMMIERTLQIGSTAHRFDRWLKGSQKRRVAADTFEIRDAAARRPDAL
ncbi:hypothetical protein MMC20_007830 [Loxospora ochrophaea]|nr:hypothetical protein [Loxospora ochrophaea]